MSDLSFSVPAASVTTPPATAPGAPPPESGGHQRGPRPAPVHASPEGTPPVWGQVPPRNPNFVGREELLDELEHRLTRATTAVVPHSLQGMGGVGKTQLAVEFAYRRRSDCDLIWWIPADGPAQIQRSLTELAARLRLPVEGEAATAVRGALEALRTGTPCGNWLLVFDNAAEPAEITPFLPVDGPGRVLVTSRSSAWRTDRDSALAVDVFDRRESTELLRRRGPEGLSAGDAEAIAERLGDLPLAIEQTAVWLRETLMPPDRWLELFEEKAADLLESARPGADYPRSVAATMNLSLERLRETDPAALHLLRVCAFFAPQPVPRRLFYGARNLEVPPELGELLADPVKLGRALRAVDQYALVKLDHRDESFRLHQLVQETVKLPLTAEERESLRHQARMLLANLDPRDPCATPNWPRYTEFLPHVWATDLVGCSDDRGRELVVGEMQFLALWGGYQEGHALGEEALRRWTRDLGPEHPQTLRASLIHAEILRKIGRFQDAYELCTRTLEALTRTRGPDDEQTLEARNILSWDLRNLGEFHQAVQVSAEAAEKHERLFGRDDPLTLGAMRLHAVGLRLTGRFQESLAIDEYNFHRQQELLGPENTTTIGSRHGCAIGLMESGRYREAEAELEHLLDQVNLIREPRSPARISVLMSLAVAKRRTGRPHTSRELSLEAWTLARERSGPDNPLTMRTAACHAVSLRVAGETDSSLELCSDTRQRYQRIFGGHHPHYAGTTVNLAVTLRLLGRVPEARRLDEEAIAILDDRLGPDHPNTIACAVNLASDLFGGGDATAATQRDTDTLHRCRQAFPVNHPLTLAVRRNLALDRHECPTMEADEELAEVHRLYQEVFGPRHPSTRSTARGVRANCDIFLPAL